MSSEIKVLYIEDSKQDGELLLHALKTVPLKTKVTQVTTIKGGEKAFEQEEFNIVMLDLNVYDSVGPFETISIIERMTDLPIIVVTGFLNSEYINKLYQEHRVLTALQKPLSGTQLEAVLKSLPG